MNTKKEKLLSKIYIKDYMNSLEKILGKKEFSIYTKNLLLSMFYKIENAYKDYKNTKREVYTKEEFLEKLLNIIKNDCNEISTMNYEQYKKEKQCFEIEKEHGKIKTLENEMFLLKSILSIGEKKICLTDEEEMLEKPFNYILSLGNKMNQVEVIRDFNGWSWDVSIKDIENIQINLIFQNLVYLFSYNYIMQWINNDSKLADYLMLAYGYLKANFGEERANEIIKLLCKLAIELYIGENKKESAVWEDLIQKTEQEAKKLNNKKQYLDEITEEKKKITKEIEKIDKMIKNKMVLQIEYDERNSKLPNKEKIFSVRKLISQLQIERQEYVDKLKKYNNLLQPNGYVARKDEVNQKYEFLKLLNLNSTKVTREKSIIKLCSLFLECFKIKIAKATIKQQIVNYIYELRYYCFIMLNEKKAVKDIEGIKDILTETMKLLLNKARNLNAIDNVTNDEEINYEIISKIFNSKMIDLNHLVIETKVKDGKLFVEYYDTNILETVIEVCSDRTVKLNKKTKLFI